MPVELTWFGHGCWSIAAGGKTLLLDPFLDNNPSSPVKAADVAADFLLVSHGHFDHLDDAAAIAARTGAKLVANFEICRWFAGQGVKDAEEMNLGGGVQLGDGIHVQMTVAHHSSTLPDGTPGGNPGGFLLSLEKRRIYFACDTALFGDMKLIGAAGLDLAVLPIGDRYTMGPDDSLRAIELLEPRRVAPAHYNTWPAIAQDAAAWAKRVGNETNAEPIVLQPGGRITL